MATNDILSELAARIRTDVFLRPKYVQSSTSLVFISAQAIALGLSSLTFLNTVPYGPGGTDVNGLRDEIIGKGALFCKGSTKVSIYTRNARWLDYGIQKIPNIKLQIVLA